MQPNMQCKIEIIRNLEQLKEKISETQIINNFNFLNLLTLYFNQNSLKYVYLVVLCVL